MTWLVTESFVARRMHLLKYCGNYACCGRWRLGLASTVRPAGYESAKYRFVLWLVIPSLVIRSNSAQFDAWFPNLLLRGYWDC